MKKCVILLIGLVLLVPALALGDVKGMEVEKGKFVSSKPSFSLSLPAEFRLVHSSSVENPGESSLTRTGFYITEVKGQVEEMLIVQIADKNNPEAGPMMVPPLKPYSEKRMYSNGKVKKQEIEIDYLVQLMAWNPEAPSLQPVLKKGVTLPSHWALQGQILFTSRAEHGVLIRYSKDVNSFGLKVSDKGDNWNRVSISGNEKRVGEIFQKAFMKMVDSIQIKNP
jgi:hypothetical protein